MYLKLFRKSFGNVLGKFAENVPGHFLAILFTKKVLPHLTIPPSPRRRAPAQLGAANGPDKIAQQVRNDDSFSEHDGAAERSEAAYVAPSPLLTKQKGDGAT